MHRDDDDEEEGDDRQEGAEVVEIPLEEVLDLHGFLPQDVPAIVGDYLDDACAAGFAEVRIVHGRGIGAQRERVRQLLAKDPRIARFKDAPFDRGGIGATMVFYDHPSGYDRIRRAMEYKAEHLAEAAVRERPRGATAP